jgi:hypothetical protein
MEPLLIDERGSIIWDLLDHRRTLDELVEILAIDFVGEQIAIRHDTEAFLDELTRHGVVEWRPAA